MGTPVASLVVGIVRPAKRESLNTLRIWVISTFVLCLGFSVPASGYQLQKCEDKWITVSTGRGDNWRVSMQINCATEDKRIARQIKQKNGKNSLSVEKVVAEAHIGLNTVIISKDTERGMISVYRMGIKPGGDREQIYLWKYRIDKDRTPQRILQNTNPLNEDYRKIGTVRQRGGEVLVAARTVGGKEYPAVFFLKNAARGEAIVYRTEVGEPCMVTREPNAPTFKNEGSYTFTPGESKWIPR